MKFISDFKWYMKESPKESMKLWKAFSHTVMMHCNPELYMRKTSDNHWTLEGVMTTSKFRLRR
jgi:hypothetical protein